MSKSEFNIKNLLEWEKEQITEELNRVYRIREQKLRVNQTPVEERIKDIKRKFIRGRI